MNDRWFRRRAVLAGAMLIASPAAARPAEPAIPELSMAAVQVRDWVAALEDNHALPYLIVDKPSATAWLFDARHRALVRVPVLLGIAPGDLATPGVGTKKLAEIGPAEKTTPAGRFLARYGVAAGRQRVLWVDYTNSVALHPIPGDAAKRERRAARLASPTGEDNRITFGCINVPSRFYAQRLRPLFQRKGGYVYVIPDETPLETVFPGVRLLPYVAPATAPGLEASRP